MIMRVHVSGTLFGFVPNVPNIFSYAIKTGSLWQVQVNVLSYYSSANVVYAHMII